MTSNSNKGEKMTELREKLNKRLADLSDDLYVFVENRKDFRFGSPDNWSDAFILAEERISRIMYAAVLHELNDVREALQNADGSDTDYSNYVESRMKYLQKQYKKDNQERFRQWLD